MTKTDGERFDIFELFARPLCRDRPLKLFEIQTSDEPEETGDVVFIFFCKKCDAEVQYSFLLDTLEEVKETIRKAVARAIATQNFELTGGGRH